MTAICAFLGFVSPRLACLLRLAAVSACLCFLVHIAPGQAWAGAEGAAFSAEAPRLLSRGWTVFRGEIVPPEAFRSGDCASPRGGATPQSVSLPDIWGPVLTTDIETGHGGATYCLDLPLAEADARWAMKLGEMRSVYAVYTLEELADRAFGRVRLLYRHGDPAGVPDVGISGAAAPVLVLPTGAEKVRLVIHLANHIHKQGGIADAPMLGSFQALDAKHRRESSVATALVMVLAAAVLVILALATSPAHFMSSLIFAALCAASAFRVFFVSTLIWDYLPNFPLPRKYDFEYLSMFLIAGTYYAFVMNLLREGRTRWFDWVVYGVCLAAAAYALVLSPLFPPGTITYLREPFQIFCAGLAASAVVFTVRSLVTSRRHRREALIVATAALVTTVYESAVSFGLIEGTMELSQLVVLLVTGMHARAFAVNFQTVEKERFYLTRRLTQANTELKDQAETLRRSADAAEQASRAKSEFLASMSHELRTPLNAIIGLSEMMKEELLGELNNPKYREYSHDIHASGKHLLALVNDILDLSRVESGSDELCEDYIDLEETIDSVIAITSNQAATAGVACRFEGSVEWPEILADQRKVRQILLNLVSNAIKFNKPGGEVIITIKREAEGLLLSVRDTGIGMRPEDIPKALTKFGQVDSDLNRRYQGIGLGLPIVKALVELHDGILTVESALGEGTCVKVHFPEERCRRQSLPDDLPMGRVFAAGAEGAATA